MPSNATLVAVSHFVGMVIGKFTVICKKTFSKLVFNKKPSAEKLLKRYLHVGNKKTCLQKTRFVENDGSAALPGNAILVAVSPFAGMVMGKSLVICEKRTFSKLVFNKRPSAENMLKRYLCVGNKKRVCKRHVLFCRK